MAGAEFVQESAPEREGMKRALLARLDAVLDPAIVIASSSSGLLMSRVQTDCRHPERCVIGHPFNPPHLVPLVEVVGGEKTGSRAIEQALAFYTVIGKQPIHIRREVPGHVANRLQAALWREALHLVAEGVASVADVDTAISAGPGLRWALMGPHLTFHLAGGVGGIDHFLDQFAAPMSSWWETLGNPTLTPELREPARQRHCRRSGRAQHRRVGSSARPLPGRFARAESRAGIAADRRPATRVVSARRADRCRGDVSR